MPLRSLRRREPMPPAAPVTNTRCMILPFLELEDRVKPCWSRFAELIGKRLVALAAVEQVAAHRRPRLSHRAGADGLHDIAMLLLEGLAVDAFGHARAAA